LPLPLVAEVIIIQVALLVAVQAQPFGATTLTLSSPPLDVKDLPSGLIE
jgi:hypothetical protein